MGFMASIGPAHAEGQVLCDFICPALFHLTFQSLRLSPGGKESLGKSNNFPAFFVNSQLDLLVGIPGFACPSSAVGMALLAASRGHGRRRLHP